MAYGVEREVWLRWKWIYRQNRATARSRAGNSLERGGSSRRGLGLSQSRQGRVATRWWRIRMGFCCDSGRMRRWSARRPEQSEGGMMPVMSPSLRSGDGRSTRSGCHQSAQPSPTRSPPTAPSARSSARPSRPARSAAPTAGCSSCTSTPRAGCTTTCGWRWTACSAPGPCPRDRRTTPPTSGSRCWSRIIRSSTATSRGSFPRGTTAPAP